MTPGIYEVLDKISKMKTTQEKIDALRAHQSTALMVVLRAALDPTVEWSLPEGTPPYKPNVLVDQQHVLLGEWNKMRFFIKGWEGDKLSPGKREMMFIEFLERLDAKDAELLCAAKEKRLSVPRITAQHVREAFPNLMTPR
jgi:hypothetical protein